MQAEPQLPPSVDLDMQAFWHDPYPVLAQMRRQTPIVQVPQMRGVLLTRHQDIVSSEKNTEVFSSEQPQGLMNQLMGKNLMRKDGKAHLIERKAMFPSVSPKTVREHWIEQFQSEADRLLAELKPRGCADLFTDYAMPLSGHALKVITGLTQVSAYDLDAWSQAMIAGIANYVGDEEPRQRCHEATQAIDEAIDERVSVLKREPDMSMLSAFLKAGMPLDSIRANIKLTISGGQNEPRDAIAGAAWALMTHDPQYRQVMNGQVDWSAVFDEYVRWISPIGMSPRRVTREHPIGNWTLLPDQQVFLMFGSANRDESVFDDADQFDVTRDTSKHIAFGAGPHFCAGAAASRALVAGVGLPTLFAALPNLKLCESDPVRLGGWAFRGVLNLPVSWSHD